MAPDRAYAADAAPAPVRDMNRAEEVSRAAATLQRGGLVAFPTDTVYALAASLAHPVAIARLFQVKRRPLAKAIPILIASITDIWRVASNYDPTVLRFVGEFWPGALTVVVPAHDDLPEAVMSRDERGRPTVAVRLPDHGRGRMLIKQAGGAIAATSANISGYSACCTSQCVLAQLGSEIDLILDDGSACEGMASTIVSLGADGPRIIRVGSVSPARLVARWNAITLDPSAR